MKHLKIYLFLVVILLFFTTCSEKDPIDTGTTVVKIDEGLKTKFDKFLYREYVKPYNISFNYTLKDIDTNMDYNVVPPYYRQSVKIANLLKYLCLDVYTKIAPQNFLQKFFPKKIVLVGSAAYNKSGTRILGAAEGGVQITLYNINELERHLSNKKKLNSLYFHTIHHEFAHILHQTKDFSTDYDKISRTEYVGDNWNKAWHWRNNPSIKKGFISDYSSKDENEDFVELFSTYITSSASEWNALIGKADQNGKQILAKKEQIMRKYFKDTWQINIDDLRNEIQQRINNLDKIDLNNIN